MLSLLSQRTEASDTFLISFSWSLVKEDGGMSFSYLNRVKMEFDRK